MNAMFDFANLRSGSGGYGAAICQMMKDLDLVLSLSQIEHSPLPLVSQIRQQFETAFIAGDGDKDFFVLFEHCARASGLCRAVESKWAARREFQVRFATSERCGYAPNEPIFD